MLRKHEFETRKKFGVLGCYNPPLPLDFVVSKNVAGVPNALKIGGREGGGGHTPEKVKTIVFLVKI